MHHESEGVQRSARSVMNLYYMISSTRESMDINKTTADTFKEYVNPERGEVMRELPNT